MKLLMLFIFTGIAEPDVALLRELYIGAATSEDKAQQLIIASETNNGNALVKGYKGAGKMLMAKYYFNPITKLNSFINGKNILEAAINSDTSNAELRYLRLTIQINSPGFLNYRESIKEDKTFLLNRLDTIEDEQLKTIIKNYLKSI